MQKVEKAIEKGRKTPVKILIFSKHEPEATCHTDKNRLLIHQAV